MATSRLSLDKTWRWKRGEKRGSGAWIKKQLARFWRRQAKDKLDEASIRRPTNGRD